jgi:hypothetical protein
MEKLRREFESLGWNRTGSVVLALACQAASRVRTCSVFISSKHVVNLFFASSVVWYRYSYLTGCSCTGISLETNGLSEKYNKEFYRKPSEFPVT